MPSHVKYNVEGTRLIDNGRVCEDVTEFTLPTLEYNTTSIEGISGMVMDVDMPDQTRLKAMELTVKHNNGINCSSLADPGKHLMECRAVRQDYSVAGGDIGHEPVKFRFTVMHKSSDKGGIKVGDPYGTTEKYSILRYEEEVNGVVVTVVDAMGGVLKFNGKDYASDVETLLA